MRRSPNCGEAEPAALPEDAGLASRAVSNIDRPVLRPLPLRPYVFAEWKKVKVNLDYHVELDGHYYSPPYQPVGKEVELRYTAAKVEVLYQGKRVASHARSRKPHANRSLPEYRPKSHSGTWTGRRAASSNGPARSVRSRLGWSRRCRPTSRTRRRPPSRR
ncbi:MAG: transposase [Bryobacteraceae bacterium]|nr:transposase [Bryobacteraceae bacterium]